MVEISHAFHLVAPPPFTRRPGYLLVAKPFTRSVIREVEVHPPLFDVEHATARFLRPPQSTINQIALFIPTTSRTAHRRPPLVLVALDIHCRTPPRITSLARPRRRPPFTHLVRHPSQLRPPVHTPPFPFTHHPHGTATYWPGALPEI
ncbi:hypothetical protein C8R46DRAFT_1220677 [Mycena filopes]|nr:hypothetical protein C8R46DRAFT_1220677 [Mycena filopes]